MNYCCYGKCAYCKNHMPVDYCRVHKKTGFFASHPACENFELNTRQINWEDNHKKARM